jgi:hypothetical protein
MACLTLLHGISQFSIPEFDDHTNKGWMSWDSIDTELDRFGVSPKRTGARMLYMYKSQWRVVQVSVPQGIAETTCVCDLLNDDASIARHGLIVEVNSLKGLPFTTKLYTETLNVLRQYFDCPVGTFCLLFKPLIVFWAVPWWEAPGTEGDLILGLPWWAFRYVATNACTSTIMVLENWFLWRGADENGTSIMGTDLDWWGKTGIFDLKWSEIFSRGCRRRSTWVLETVTAAEVAEWCDRLPGTLQMHGAAIKRHKFDGSGLQGMTAADLKEIGVVNIGERYIILQLIDKLRSSAERNLYRNEYMPPSGTVPFSLRVDVPKSRPKQGSKIAQTNGVREMEFDLPDQEE